MLSPASIVATCVSDFSGLPDECFVFLWLVILLTDERSDSPAHHLTHSSNHGDRHLHPSASAESLSQHNLSNKFGPSSSLPNMSSSGNMVTSPSDESASNHGNTSLSEQDNNTTSQGNWICIGTL